MAKINQWISDIKGLIKKADRNPEVYSDQFLYSLLNGARARVLEQNANKLNHESEWDWMQFPIKLIKAKSHLVGCVTVGCDVLRSENKIPRALLTNNLSKVKVTTYDYTKIALVTEQSFSNNAFDDIKSKTPQASIINGYLVIWNKPTLKSVLINGIWEDVLQWAVIPYCDEDGNMTNGVCFDAISQDFPLSETLKDVVYEFVIQKLKLPLQLLADTTNDSNGETRS